MCTGKITQLPSSLVCARPTRWRVVRLIGRYGHVAPLEPHWVKNSHPTESADPSLGNECEYENHTVPVFRGLVSMSRATLSLGTTKNWGCLPVSDRRLTNTYTWLGDQAFAASLLSNQKLA